MPETQSPNRAVVSLFAGGGGFDAGLEQAGFSTVLAIDNDPDAVRTLLATKEARLPIEDGRSYLADARVVEADVTKTTKAELLAMYEAATSAGPPAVLAGGPPCQSFSSAGRMQGLADDRGLLFRHFVRAARALRPDVVLFENVQGLVTARDADGQVGGVLRLVEESFLRAGYVFVWSLVNAADYGAAQRRVRLIGVGTKRHELPAMPPPAAFAREAAATSLLPWRTIRQALAGMGQPTESEVVKPRPELQQKLRDVEPGKGIRVGGLVEANRPSGHWGYRQDGFVADWDQPARTIRAASTPDWLRLPDGSHRRLTWQECARLQGFPDDWRFEGTTTSRFRQIGNAVPIDLARVLGETVAAVLDAGPLPTRRRPVAPPWPKSFRRRIRYTTSEDRVNGEARRSRREKAVA